MNKLLIATTNPAKIEEIRRFLGDVPLAPVSLSETGVTGKPEETGGTFEENAIIKAEFYCRASGLPALADDGGLEIDALGGEPGVHSHRWVNRDREDTDEELIAHTLSRLEGIGMEKRTARMRVVNAIVLPDGSRATGSGTVEGVIPLQASPVRIPGFPYRSLLYLPDIGKFFNHDDLTPSENDRYNHRKRSIESLKPFIREHLCSI